MKPVVKYRASLLDIVVGLPALVEPIDHPSPLVTNTKPVYTSNVVGITPRGFETENTVYVFERDTTKQAD